MHPWALRIMADTVNSFGASLIKYFCSGGL
jgi:hypothetical protein